MKARIYTKTGDKGETSLVGGSRVSKTHPRLAAYGTLDELNSIFGLIRAHLPQLGTSAADFDRSLQTVQNNLFNMGSHLACEDAKVASSLPGLSAGGLSQLEVEMDKWEAELPPLKQFILPGGSVLAGFAHQARTVCRRAEREVLKLSEDTKLNSEDLIYLNRLSDWCFLLARKFNSLQGINDIPWNKG